MICDDLSYTHEGVPDRFKTIKYYGFTSSYQIQLYPYSFIFHHYSSPTQAAITKDLSLIVAEDLSTLCLVLYPTWLLWLVQFPQGRFRLHSIRDEEAKLGLEENKIVAFIKLDFGNVVMVTGGRNRGSVGVIRNRAKLKGSFETTTTYKTQQDMSLQQG
ncbi:unnamed protein product [Brassica rapa]|uniref:KOW domain-containing protein n=1 Tax=Brassica campestris TaxID=3711 RepID=A0A8D9FYS8_BRACM|nr:unnamed protein product [Brassica rapa]